MRVKQWLNWWHAGSETQPDYFKCFLCIVENLMMPWYPPLQIYKLVLLVTDPCCSISQAWSLKQWDKTGWTLCSIMSSDETEEGAHIGQFSKPTWQQKVGTGKGSICNLQIRFLVYLLVIDLWCLLVFGWSLQFRTWNREFLPIVLVFFLIFIAKNNIDGTLCPNKWGFSFCAMKKI